MRIRFDSRHFRWWWQRRIRGFDDRELWSLDDTIARFILPRLKRFADSPCSYPPNLTMKQWREILDKMVTAFEYYATDDKTLMTSPESDEGLKLFSEYFGHLWY